VQTTLSEKEYPLMFNLSDDWKTTYPAASVGILAMGNVENPAHHEGLEARKAELEASLRERYAGYDRAQLRALPILAAYHTYYRRFKKTYHVQLQLESVAFKDRSIPRVAALVEAMFMAELDSLLLTAGHDLDVVQSPTGVDVADGSERYVTMNGQEQELKAGDMFIADAEGVLSSILYGPDQRTRITSETRRALFTVYAPEGIENTAVASHLRELEALVRLIAPAATTAELKVYGAG
jgi:DNA/RNA-binding domain of Phe-tRNA-synthetase-like protein